MGQAVAAWKAGFKGLILPKANLSHLSGDWPDSSPSDEQRQHWAEARQQLVFKGVDTVEELLGFLFPSLTQKLEVEKVAAPQPRQALPGGGANREQSAAEPQDGEADVGPVTWTGVPMTGKTLGPDGVLTKVEVCVVRGAGQPVRDDDTLTMTALCGSLPPYLPG